MITLVPGIEQRFHSCRRQLLKSEQRFLISIFIEAATQIAQILAALIRRVQAIPDTPGTGVGRADQLERR
jgi:hypothetical protein